SNTRYYPCSHLPMSHRSPTRKAMDNPWPIIPNSFAGLSRFKGGSTHCFMPTHRSLWQVTLFCTPSRGTREFVLVLLWFVPLDARKATGVPTCNGRKAASLHRWSLKSVPQGILSH